MLEDGTLPTERLRKLEVEANAAFDQYRQMYFEGGVSSVYLWDLEHGFAGKLTISSIPIQNYISLYCDKKRVIAVAM